MEENQRVYRYSAWRTRYRCKKCHCVTSWGTMMQSHGTCPECGHTSGYTVNDTDETAIRFCYTARSRFEILICKLKGKPYRFIEEKEV